jgi:undecaprenyl-diphosphatase
LDTLLALDEQLFRIINGGWHNEFLDWLMPYWRDKKFWYPLYLGLIAFILYRFRVKGIYLLLTLFITVGIADLVSSKVLKTSVKRVRPCNDPAVQDDVILLVGCGKAYSFTSSHATNHFAIGVFLALTLGLYYKRWRWLFYFWAASIAFGQVYVGVHYPLDVLVGAFLGTAIALLTSTIYFRFPKHTIERPV